MWIFRILLLLASSAAFAQAGVVGLLDQYDRERILSYRSEIQVNADASMEVTETIRVVALGADIKRGIYRDFPTEYRTPWGFRTSTGFRVIEVLRDGRPEPYHTEAQSNGMRVYAGDKDVLIPPGVYTYVFRYRTDRQVGFFPDHDELYWNVTGNGWKFPIDEATARVRLPAGVARSDVKTEGYTGDQGATEKNFTASVEAGGAAVFRTTAALEPSQGLTIVVTFPKGVVREPTQPEKWAFFLKENRMEVFGALGLFAILFYYVLVWFQVGRDPRPGTIIPLFEAPQNLSPAAARFIRRMGYDDKALAASLIHLAVAKRIKILDEGGTYVLERLSGGEFKLASEENRLLQNLLGADPRLEIKQAHRTTIVAAVEGLKKDLKASFEKAYFLTNRGYFFAGLGVTLISLLFALFQGGAGATVGAGFMTVWLTGWTFGVVMLVRQALAAWRAAWNARGIIEKSFSFFGAGFTTLFALPFLAGEVVGLYMFGQATSAWMLAVLLAAVAINLVFFSLLKAPTLGGRKVLDRIEGLRMYLGTAERDRLEAMHPPQKTPELFEQFLPYALALDVENEWAEQFTGVLTEAGKPVTESSRAWYAGAAGLGTAAFASSLGSSLTSAIASASVSPSSHSGSGGGGSSGGGGGGGGGGGW
ncbi:MAG TPA: DUF2207 domain-containing protein [bacterium]|nr:DUF2207 domain-containing protein [bacterium]